MDTMQSMIIILSLLAIYQLLPLLKGLLNALLYVILKLGGVILILVLIISLAIYI